jgi:hypothetical protein
VIDWSPVAINHPASHILVCEIVREEFFRNGDNITKDDCHHKQHKSGPHYELRFII